MNQASYSVMLSKATSVYGVIQDCLLSFVAGNRLKIVLRTENFSHCRELESEKNPTEMQYASAGGSREMQNLVHFKNRIAICLFRIAHEGGVED